MCAPLLATSRSSGLLAKGLNSDPSDIKESFVIDFKGSRIRPKSSLEMNLEWEEIKKIVSYELLPNRPFA